MFLQLPGSGQKIGQIQLPVGLYGGVDDHWTTKQRGDESDRYTDTHEDCSDGQRRVGAVAQQEDREHGEGTAEGKSQPRPFQQSKQNQPAVNAADETVQAVGRYIHGY